MAYHAFMPEDWWDYVSRIAGPDAAQKDIAEHTGIEQSTLSRWKLHKNPPNADAVVRFARSYGQSPIAALIAARYLDVDEANNVVEIVTAPASELSTSELVGQIRDLFGELRRRIPEIGAVVDKAQDWPESFFEGASEQSAPVRRSKHR
jgi:transcriptional regulator with XRE-family HTH domain